MSSSNLTLNTVQFSELPHIDTVTPISLSDLSCLEEVRAVLEKHDCLSRFGVTLLHQHFEVSDAEILVETCDSEKRTLTARPIPKGDSQHLNLIQTVWRFDGQQGQNCVRYCPMNPKGQHYGYPDHR